MEKYLNDEEIGADSVAAEKHLAARWKPQNPDADRIGKDALRRVCAALLAMQRRWNQLAIGEAFVVEWPLRRK